MFLYLFPPAEVQSLMPAPVIKNRTYSFRVKLPNSSASDAACKNLREHVERRASRGRRLHALEPMENALCALSVRLTCDSCGKWSLDRLRKEISADFPDAEFDSFDRQR
jgi:hypothetical protein